MLLWGPALVGVGVVTWCAATMDAWIWWWTFAAIGLFGAAAFAANGAGDMFPGGRIGIKATAYCGLLVAGMTLMSWGLFKWFGMTHAMLDIPLAERFSDSHRNNVPPVGKAVRQGLTYWACIVVAGASLSDCDSRQSLVRCRRVVSLGLTGGALLLFAHACFSFAVIEGSPGLSSAVVYVGFSGVEALGSGALLVAALAVHLPDA